MIPIFFNYFIYDILKNIQTYILKFGSFKSKFDILQLLIII